MKLLAILMLCLDTLSLASPEVKASKAMIIEGPITTESIYPLAKEILSRVQSGEKEIQIIIDSPGGEVGAGYTFIDVMEAAKNNGAIITCFVPRMAASMGYQIFMHCNERYVLAHSMLLWHHVRVDIFMAMLGVNELLPLARDLAEIDQHILGELLYVMGDNMPPDTIKWYFDHETLHNGYFLANQLPNVMVSYSYIPGLLESLTNPDIPRTTIKDAKQLKFRTPVYLYPVR